ncbi:MAG: methyltransferase [Alphaproteobacteria bacterium]|nr:MAG: methyltransferase [Alphaproteobacteria bacterium]
MSIATEGQTGHRRARRRPGAAPGASVPPAAPWQWRNPFPPIELFSADRIEAIHVASLTLLEEIGLRILHAEARRLYRAAGAAVDEADARVRFDRGLVMEAVGRAPAVVRLHARNPAHDVEVGGNAVAVTTVGGPPNCSDLERGRRPGTLADFADFMRLAQSFDVIHVLNQAVEPLDVDLRFRHLETTRTQITLSDKVPFVFSRGAGQVRDALEMIRIARGVTAEVFAEQPSCDTVINSNSPLQLDEVMCQGIIDFARAGQLMILTPFTLAGAMAPVTVAGALVQQNAEALAGIALAQIVRPGTPVGYGGFTSNVDMRSGAPAFGTPEYVQACFATGQLARRYRLPWRSSNANASNAPDAQSVYESQMSLWGALMGGCNFLIHGAGWLEGGLTASFEKFVIDVEMLRMFRALFQPVPCDDAALALDAVREVGPGGHYFGAAHTLARYGTAFYSPVLSDWRNYETWKDAGAVDATRRAHALYKRTLAEFEPPPLDPAIKDELDAFVARRRAEGGAAPGD